MVKVSIPVMITQLRALSREYKRVYDKLVILSTKFRAGMPSTPLEVLIPDTEIVDKVREAGDAASIAIHRTLETVVWLNAAADELAKIAKAEKKGGIW